MLATSRHGVIYRRETRTFGCLYNDDVERALPLGGPGIVSERSPKLAGRFVAYVVVSTDAEFVAVYDVRNDRLTARERAVAGGGVDAVRAHVVKANGSFAWIRQGPRNIESQPGRQDATGDLEVHRRQAGRRRSRLLASGDDVNRSYLALSRDRRWVVWRQAGVKQRARLP